MLTALLRTGEGGAGGAERRRGPEEAPVGAPKRGGAATPGLVAGAGVCPAQDRLACGESSQVSARNFSAANGSQTDKRLVPRNWL